VFKVLVISAQTASLQGVAKLHLGFFWQTVVSIAASVQVLSTQVVPDVALQCVNAAQIVVFKAV